MTREPIELSGDSSKQTKWQGIASLKSHRFLSCIVFAGTFVELEPMTATLSSLSGSSGAYGAGNCIDGDKGTLCHTGAEATPWIAVDYGTRVIVERVEIFNRISCCGDRTRNVDIRISNELPTSGSQMFSGGTLLGHFAGPATDGQHIIVSGQKLL